MPESIKNCQRTQNLCVVKTAAVVEVVVRMGRIESGKKLAFLFYLKIQKLMALFCKSGKRLNLVESFGHKRPVSLKPAI